MKLPTRIPTILGLLLVVVIVAGVIVLEQVFRSPSNASGSQQPENITITNISDTSFAFSWTTQLPATGTLLVSSQGRSNRIYFDSRDITGKLGTYTTHMVSVRDASAQTEYSITILSNGKQYLDSGKPFTINTPRALSLNSNGLEPAYGVIRTINNEPHNDVLVYLTVEGGQELSALSNSSGVWLIPLNQVRTSDLTSFLPTVERMTENILVRSYDLQGSAITDTLNDSPVPEMIIGKTYDFRRQQAITSSTKTIALRGEGQPQANPAVLGTTTSKSFSVAITTPAQGAALTTTLPYIQGTGIPNAYVGVSLGVTQIISGSAKVDTNGLWSFTPPKKLAPGSQSVTITTVDVKGKTVAITHTFEILKSGTQVLGDATPSAALTPVTLTPTPTTITVSTLSGEPPPISGNQLPAILIIMLGIGLFTGGIFAIL